MHSNESNRASELQELITRAWRSQIFAPLESVQLAEQAHAQALALGDPLAAAHAAVTLAIYNARQGNFDEAEVALEALSEFFEQQDDQLGVVRAMFGLSIINSRRGNGNAGYAIGVATLKKLERVDEPFDLMLFHNALGSDSTLTGHFDISLRHYFAALTIAREHGFYDCEAMILSNIGDAQHDYGNNDGAIGYLEQSYALVLKHDVKSLLHAVIENLAASLLASGAHKQAVALIETLLQNGNELDAIKRTSLQVSSVPSFMALAAQAYAMSGDWLKAEAAIREARSGAAFISDVPLQLRLGWALGDIERGRGHLGEALANLEQAAALLDRFPTSSPADAVRIFSGLADTHAALENWHAAYDYLTRHRIAYDQLHSSGARARIQTAQIHAELAQAERERDQAKLNQLVTERERAYTDPLTGLANRERLRLDGDALLSRGIQPLVLLLNVKRFRAINGLLGHEIGDAVLIKTGQRLAAIAGAQVGRLHADRFCLIWPYPDRDEVLHQEISSSFADPLQVDDQRIDVDLAIGVARSPEHGETMSTLMRNAEIALHANRHQRVEWTEYAIDHESARRADLDLLSALRQAVERDELRLYLQPKVRATDGRVISAEALVRWQHPVRGLVQPVEFIPFAEQIGGIGQLTHWMLREAMRLTARLQTSGEPLQISVNLSTHDLRDPLFVQRAASLAVETGADPAYIRLEITESGVMDNPAVMLGVLRDLHTAGFTLSIDDFGTGHSSLAYLQKMPVSELKIDRAFVKGVEPHSDGATLLESIISLAHRLGLSVVAEGAETASEWALLVALGCDFVQGWYAAKPMPIPDFLAWRLAHDPFTWPIAPSSSIDARGTAVDA